MSLDSIVVTDLNTIWHPNEFANQEPLPDPPPRQSIGAGVGIGIEQPRPSITSSSGSSVSTYTETSRTLHSTQAVSSDGLFVWSVPETITMTDSNGETVVFTYAEPA